MFPFWYKKSRKKALDYYYYPITSTGTSTVRDQEKFLYLLVRMYVHYEIEIGLRFILSL